MQNNPAPDRSQHVKSAKSALWLLVFLGVAFAVVIFKFVFGHTSRNASNGLPGSEDTYKAAQQFIRENAGNESVNFPLDGYQYAKKGDSTYSIRTVIESNDDGDNKNITYSLIMKYKGGTPDNSNSWELLDINRN